MRSLNKRKTSSDACHKVSVVYSKGHQIGTQIHGSCILIIFLGKTISGKKPSKLQIKGKWRNMGKRRNKKLGMKTVFLLAYRTESKSHITV